MAKRPDAEKIEPKSFRNADEIDRAIVKLQRRISETSDIDLHAAVYHHTGAKNVAESHIRDTIREIYGQNSPECEEHKHLSLYGGSMAVGMPDSEIMEGYEKGRRQVIATLNGLIVRLREKREDLEGGARPTPSSYFDKLNLHPRIADVARDLFLDGHHFEAVFAGSKALINFIKERSGCHDLDGAPLMRTAFSKNKPILAFNPLSSGTDHDQQEGLMHLFEGAVLGIRNPGGHSFPEGTEQRAIEYLSLLSLLAYLAQEAKKTPSAR